MEKYYTYVTNSSNTNFYPAYGNLDIAKVFTIVVAIKETESTTNKR